MNIGNCIPIGLCRVVISACIIWHFSLPGTTFRSGARVRLVSPEHVKVVCASAIIFYECEKPQSEAGFWYRYTAIFRLQGWTGEFFDPGVTSL
jgi:hypothetical protein